jgi:hypothetical protein
LQHRLFTCNDATGSEQVLLQVLQQVAAVLNECVPGPVGSYSESLASVSPYQVAARTSGVVTPGARAEADYMSARVEPCAQQEVQEAEAAAEQQQQLPQAVLRTPASCKTLSQNMEGLILARDSLAKQVSG